MKHALLAIALVLLCSIELTSLPSCARPRVEIKPPSMEILKVSDYPAPESEPDTGIEPTATATNSDSESEPTEAAITLPSGVAEGAETYEPAPEAPAVGYAEAMSDEEFLAMLAQRESHGDPWAIGGGGTYVGMYQLSRSAYGYSGIDPDEALGDAEAQRVAVIAYIYGHHGGFDEAKRFFDRYGYY
jgi:hypothetical protein